MEISNQPAFSADRLAPLTSVDKKEKTESPTTIATTFFYPSDNSSSQVSIEQVVTDPVVKGILKKNSAYTAMRNNGKVSTERPSRSISFAENSTSNDGEVEPTKPPSITIVATNHQSGRRRSSSAAPPAYLPATTTMISRPRSKSAPPNYLPNEYAPDAALEKAISDTGKFIAGGLSKAASAVADFIKRPEDFFIPEQPKQKQSSTSTPSGKKKSGK